MAIESFRRIFGKKNQGETKGAQSPVEKAISVWESDPEKNQEEYKIIRGLDGKPVEVVLEKSGKNPIFAIRANGKNIEQFQIGGEMQTERSAFGNLILRHFIKRDIFDKWYDLKGVQHLDVKVGKKHQGFLFGLSGDHPEVLSVGPQK